MDQKLSPRRQLYDKGLRVLLWLCAGITCALLLFLIGYIVYRGVPASLARPADHRAELSQRLHRHPAELLNTLYLILLTMVIVLPIGVSAAIYLTEYAKNRRVVAIIEFATETLTGIPSIIFGLVGMLFFVQLLSLKGRYSRRAA